MKTTTSKSVLSLAAVALSTLGAIASPTLVTISNRAAGNTLELFTVASNGALTHIDSVQTGGNGLGSGLGSQNAVDYDRESALLATVNAGSDTISLFRVEQGMPTLINTFSSGGSRPVSVTLRGNQLFVANQGNATHPSSIHGFRLVFGGAIALVDDAGLSNAGFVNPAQIEFSPNGRSLVVTEKGTNKVDVFDLNAFGQIVSSQYADSSGQTPFGFDFDREGRLYVSEAFGGAANASAVSSYRRLPSGRLQTLTASAKTNQTAACWVKVTPNGRFVYTTNAGSGTVSGYRIRANGVILLSSTTSPIVGSTPTDIASDLRGETLFVLQAGAMAVQSYRIGADGTLTPAFSASTPTRSAGLVYIN